MLSETSQSHRDKLPVIPLLRGPWSRQVHRDRAEDGRWMLGEREGKLVSDGDSLSLGR